MNRDLKRVPFARALSACGFRRRDAGRDPLIYSRIIRDRELEVQLWKDGGHRVSHYVIREIPGRPAEPPFLGRCMTTHPTDFRTVAAMHAAILAELSRTDHKPDEHFYLLGFGAATRLVRERRRQVEVEGWTAAHDDAHAEGAMARAAAAYAYAGSLTDPQDRFLLRRQAKPVPEARRSGVRAIVEALWPWAWSWWKPGRAPLPQAGEEDRDLERAGALIIAELERRDRARQRDDDAAWASMAGRAA